MDALMKLLNQINRKVKIKQINRSLQSSDYIIRRLDILNDEVIHWMSSRNQCNTEKERRFCDEMAEMYKKRYEWYLNNWK